MISRSTCCRAEVKFTKKISFISQCKYFIFLLSFITKKNRFSTFSSCSSYFMHSVFCFPVIIIVSEARQPASSLFAFLCVLILLIIIMVRIQTSLSLYNSPPHYSLNSLKIRHFILFMKAHKKNIPHYHLLSSCYPCSTTKTC